MLENKEPEPWIVRDHFDECVFIGGPLDGKLRLVGAIYNEGMFGVDGGGSAKYRRLEITVGKLTISVFVAGLITDEMALKMLVDGYCKEDSK